MRRWNKEEIKYHKIDESSELIYKGEAKTEEGDDNSEKKEAILKKIQGMGEIAF